MSSKRLHHNVDLQSFHSLLHVVRTKTFRRRSQLSADPIQIDEPGSFWCILSRYAHRSVIQILILSGICCPHMIHQITDLICHYLVQKLAEVPSTLYSLLVNLVPMHRLYSKKLIKGTTHVSQRSQNVLGATTYTGLTSECLVHRKTKRVCG